MCYYVRLEEAKDSIEERFGAKFGKGGMEWPAGMVNGFSLPSMPAIKDSSPETITGLKWGLEPLWGGGKRILNCRIETAEEKKQFMDIASNRCIIPVSGFFEWMHAEEAGKKVKKRYYITPHGDNLMALGGIYDRNGCFTIVTTEANELMASIHNTEKRMPVVLSRHEEKSWLSGESLQNFADRKHIGISAAYLPV